MKNSIVTSMVGCVLAGADHSDRPVGVIRAGVRTVRKASVAVCGYCSSSGDHLCAYRPTGFPTTDAVEMNEYCRSHCSERR